ncbi:MAG: hypothetical protein CVV16_05250 [Gammaproteobacteria bacterium HGW-Gammaproteobacteria-6]|nr:MAG: hypothetical protein CVV16_05250 [Gammaproteobacteria bacterium HGW-Gammaproteobacteria-6]
MSDLLHDKPQDVSECRSLFKAQQGQPHDWHFVSDQVMGGCSVGRIDLLERAGRACICMRGEVSLANNGGFVQVRMDWPQIADTTDYHGLYLVLLGDGHAIDVRLKTSVLQHPWQSFRTSLQPGQQWQSWWLPFSDFQPHRTDAVFEPATLRSIGLVAIGEAMSVDLCVAELGMYR